MPEKVLVIEDDTLILDGIVRNLRYEGYETFVATDGEDGLRKACLLYTSPSPRD